MAYADGRLFVPVVDLCGRGSATTSQPLTELDPSQGAGRLVALDAATGRTLWERRLPSPDFGCATVSNDVVFTSTYDGAVYALAAGDGRIVWQAQMQAGVNACPAVVGDLVLFGAGIRKPGGASPELVAFGPRLRRRLSVPGDRDRVRGREHPTRSVPQRHPIRDRARRFPATKLLSGMLEVRFLGRSHQPPTGAVRALGRGTDRPLLEAHDRPAGRTLPGAARQGSFGGTRLQTAQT